MQKRYTISTNDTEDAKIREFLNAQTNVSATIKVLLKLIVQQYGSKVNFNKKVNDVDWEIRLVQKQHAKLGDDTIVKSNDAVETKNQVIETPKDEPKSVDVVPKTTDAIKDDTPNTPTSDWRSKL